VRRVSICSTTVFCVVAELLRQFGAGAAAIGNTELQEKFAEGNRLLKHGIIFAGSLYL
jgi:ATP-dependent RNA helicase DOB1